MTLTNSVVHVLLHEIDDSVYVMNHNAFNGPEHHPSQDVDLRSMANIMRLHKVRSQVFGRSGSTSNNMGIGRLRKWMMSTFTKAPIGKKGSDKLGSA
uniref:Uncharacterized protein n=1 Tax=Grammatophora oceanica TaxID=210454 RepID=A0A7S1Y3L5_9STRA